MTDRSTKLIAFGIVAAVAGLFLVVWTGLGTLTEDRDADGYLMSNPLTIDRTSPVVVSNDIGLLRGHYECVSEDSLVAFLAEPDDVRLIGTAAGPGELFVGIAPANTVAAYLDGVAHDEITDWECDQHNITPVEYTVHEGSAVPDAPSAQTFWTMSVSGTGQQTLDWTIKSGEWAVVIMHTDGPGGVSADVRFGALAPSAMMTIAWVSVAVGLPLLIAGSVMLFIGIRRNRRTTTHHPDHGETEPRRDGADEVVP